MKIVVKSLLSLLGLFLFLLLLLAAQHLCRFLKASHGVDLHAEAAELLTWLRPDSTLQESEPPPGAGEGGAPGGSLRTAALTADVAAEQQQQAGTWQEQQLLEIGSSPQQQQQHLHLHLQQREEKEMDLQHHAEEEGPGLPFLSLSPPPAGPGPALATATARRLQEKKGEWDSDFEPERQALPPRIRGGGGFGGAFGRRRRAPGLPGKGTSLTRPAGSPPKAPPRAPVGAGPGALAERPGPGAHAAESPPNGAGTEAWAWALSGTGTTGTAGTAAGGEPQIGKRVGDAAWSVEFALPPSPSLPEDPWESSRRRRPSWELQGEEEEEASASGAKISV